VLRKCGTSFCGITEIRSVFISVARKKCESIVSEVARESLGSSFSIIKSAIDLVVMSAQRRDQSRHTAIGSDPC
jgi:hypothetical protein